jgi:hypothetical protein
MSRSYKLETFAKGTGATVVPTEGAAESRAAEEKKLNTVRMRHEPRKQKSKEPARTTPLPAGHVRKKATGEIGRVQAVDPQSGTVTVLWLKQGRSSTVPLTAVSRR